jgi:hypothetical protein
MAIVRQMIQKLKELNLFANAETMRKGDRQVLRDQVVSTRVYIILLIITLCILVVSTLLIERTTSTTVSTPSLALYEQLQVDYPDTLSCPCQQVAVSYSTFISIMEVFHQVKDFFDSKIR